MNLKKSFLKHCEKRQFEINQSQLTGLNSMNSIEASVSWEKTLILDSIKYKNINMYFKLNFI